MTLEISRRVLDLAIEEYTDPNAEWLSVRTHYSGRYMYGRSCLGVVGRAGDLIRFVLEIVPAIDPNKIAAAGDSDVVYSEEWFEVLSDSMGMDTIFYWPEVEVITDEPDDAHPADVRYDNSDPN